MKFRRVVMMVVYNRFNYTASSLLSLSAIRWSDTLFFFIDHGSTDPRIYPILEAFSARMKNLRMNNLAKIHLIGENAGRGDHSELFDILKRYMIDWDLDIEYILLTTNDMIYNPWFCEALEIGESHLGEIWKAVSFFEDNRGPIWGTAITPETRIEPVPKGFHQFGHMDGLAVSFRTDFFLTLKLRTLDQILTEGRGSQLKTITAQLNRRILNSDESLVEHIGLTGANPGMNREGNEICAIRLNLLNIPKILEKQS